MDQLKQVLKYQFWILLGVALLLPLVGWAMSTSGMQDETSKRSKELDGLDKSLTATPNDPNQEWTDGLTVVNREQEKQKDLAWRALFELQAPFHVWPAKMPDDPATINAMHLDIYSGTGYVSESERIRKIVKPVDEDGQNGLLYLPDDFPPPLQELWTFQLPSRNEIIAAQEDIWLYTALLSAIARVNGQAPSIYDAPVREIVELFLRGGSPRGTASGGASKTATTGTSGTTGTMPAGADMMKGLGGIMGGPMGGVGGMDTQGGNRSGVQEVKISLDEEFGAERPATDAKPAGASPATGGTGGTGGTSTAPTPGGSTAQVALPPPGTSMPSMTSGSGTSRGGGANMNRYCDDKKKEWKTRGFSLEVVMDHRAVPDLLVELSNCPGWPINILRVNVADTQDEDLQREDGRGGMGMGMGIGGAGGLGRGMGGAGMGPGAGDMMRGAMRRGGGGRRDDDGMGAPPAGGIPRMKPKARRAGDDDDVGERPVISKHSPLDDPNLARVAIVGVIYIFNEPDAPVPAATPGAQPQTAPPAAPVAAAPAEAESAAATETAAVEEKSDAKTGEDESPDEAAGAPSAAPGDKDEPDAKPSTEDKPSTGDSKGTR
jgi:hypothetical protein